MMSSRQQLHAGAKEIPKFCCPKTLLAPRHRSPLDRLGDPTVRATTGTETGAVDRRSGRVAKGPGGAGVQGARAGEPQPEHQGHVRFQRDGALSLAVPEPRRYRRAHERVDALAHGSRSAPAPRSEAVIAAAGEVLREERVDVPVVGLHRDEQLIEPHRGAEARDLERGEGRPQRGALRWVS
jgi:hypothetical protein